jgi:hypothetical protein
VRKKKSNDFYIKQHSIVIALTFFIKTMNLITFEIRFIQKGINIIVDRKRSCSERVGKKKKRKHLMALLCKCEAVEYI